MNESPISVCIFGSMARGLTDALSDKDVLVIANDAPALEIASGNWIASGWNVSAFRRERFDGLIRFKSLFIQHLKLEGAIVRDDEGYLRRVLAKFVPQESYMAEVQDAFRPLKWVLSGSPRGWAAMCASDILFVMARNVAILHAASSGRHIYDYPRLVQYMREVFLLSGEDCSTLLLLRELKSSYRSRLMVPGADEVLLKAVTVLTRIHDCIGSTVTSTSFLPNRYQDLRQIELTLVTKNDPRELDNLPGNHDLARIWQLICDPREYPQMRGLASASWQFGAYVEAII